MALVRKQFRKKLEKPYELIDTECKKKLCRQFEELINDFITQIIYAVEAWNEGKSKDEILQHFISAEHYGGQVGGQITIIREIGAPDLKKAFEAMYNDERLEYAGSVYNKLSKLV